MSRHAADDLDYGRVVEAVVKSALPSKKYCGRMSRIAVDVFLVLAQIGGFAVYCLFIAQNLKKVLESKAFGFEADYRLYLVLALVPTLLLCSIRDLSKLSKVMVLANICEFYVIAVVFYYIFRDDYISKNNI